MAEGKKKSSKTKVEISFSGELPVRTKGTSSIELKRNAKGNTEILIKVYTEDPKKGSAEAIGIYNSLCEKYKT